MDTWKGVCCSWDGLRRSSCGGFLTGIYKGVNSVLDVSFWVKSFQHVSDMAIACTQHYVQHFWQEKFVNILTVAPTFLCAARYHSAFWGDSDIYRPSGSAQPCNFTISLKDCPWRGGYFPWRHPAFVMERFDQHEVLVPFQRGRNRRWVSAFVVAVPALWTCDLLTHVHRHLKLEWVIKCIDRGHSTLRVYCITLFTSTTQSAYVVIIWLPFFRVEALG